MKLLLALCLVCSALAQDTYNCPDGWEKEEDRSGCRCFKISEWSAVTRDDADILCAGLGAWVAELDHPGKVKSKFLRLLYLGHVILSRSHIWSDLVKINVSINVKIEINVIQYDC